MTTNELKILEIIWAWGGEASVDTVTREAKISMDYVRLLCKSLAKENYIDFLRSKLCRMRSKGKLELVRRKIKGPSKIAVNNKNSSALERNKQGGLILNY